MASQKYIYLILAKFLPGFYSVDIVTDDMDENDEYEEEKRTCRIF